MGRRPPRNTTSQEDNLSGRQSNWKTTLQRYNLVKISTHRYTTSKEDDLTGRQLYRKTISNKDNLRGRQLHRKTTSQEDNFTGRQLYFFTFSKMLWKFETDEVQIFFCYKISWEMLYIPFWNILFLAFFVQYWIQSSKLSVCIWGYLLIP